MSLEFLDSFKRSYHFRQKMLWRGLEVLRPDEWPINNIILPIPNDWWENWLQGRENTIYNSPHYYTLVHPVDGKSAYYYWQLSIRGIDHPRPDEWIRGMEARLFRLRTNISTFGYKCKCVADRIAVMEDGLLVDGGHRLACLAALGYTHIPVVILKERHANHKR